MIHKWCTMLKWSKVKTLIRCFQAVSGLRMNFAKEWTDWSRSHSQWFSAGCPHQHSARLGICQLSNIYVHMWLGGVHVGTITCIIIVILFCVISRAKTLGFVLNETDKTTIPSLYLRKVLCCKRRGRIQGSIVPLHKSQGYESQSNMDIKLTLEP